jgi:general secretion pathway protein B
MSYILDALRRAEAERARERGEVPGLNAQPEPASLGDDAHPGAANARVRHAGIGAAVLVLAALAWWGLRPEPAAPPAANASQPPLSSVPPAPRQPVAAAPAGPALLVAPPAPPAAPVATSPAPPRPVAPVPVPAPAPTALASTPPAAAPSPPATTPPPDAPPAPQAAPADRAARAAARPAPASAAAASVAPAAPAAPAIVPLSSLSAAQRAELPPMAIGGAIYSEQAASRFIVINGSVIREGEHAAPGVVLERIAPKSATLRWRDMRIEVPI